MRGYAAIGLDRVKCAANLGGVLRAAGCYGAALVVIGDGRLGKYATDTMKAYKHIPCIEAADVMDGMPFGSMPVVIEISDKARCLTSFVHPESAYYIFGPEDGSVRKSIVESMPLVVSVPTAYCMNLAATVNVVLYDRIAKMMR